MKLCSTLGPRDILSVTRFAVLAGALTYIMLSGHGQVDDQQLAKVIRTRIINRRIAEAVQLTEMANTLRVEADLMQDMSDALVLQQYAGEAGDVNEDAIASTAPGNNTSLPDTFLLDETQEAEQSGQIRQQEEAAPQLHTDIDDKLAMGKHRWQVNMNNIEDILKTANCFELSENNTQDFEALSKLAYDEALKEAGLDDDPKEAAMKLAAETGHFDVQGGQIRNMWARLPKDNPYKARSAQASIRTP